MRVEVEKERKKEERQRQRGKIKAGPRVLALEPKGPLETPKARRARRFLPSVFVWDSLATTLILDFWPSEL